MILPSSGNPGPLNLNTEADRVLQGADVFAYHATSGNIDASLRAICRLRSRCDVVARELVQQQFAPMENAKVDLSRILAAKGGAK